MSHVLNCRVVTPTEELLAEPVTHAQVPAWDGLFGVLPGHAPFVAELGIGELHLKFPSETHGGGDRAFYIDGGFVKVAGDDIIILAEQAIPVEQITETDAKAELAEAEARHPQSAEDADTIRLDRDRARAKLHIARKFRGSGRGI